MADEADHQLSPDRRMFINGHPEERYWTEVELGPRSGEWTSFGAGPPVSVVVTPRGIELYGRGLRMDGALRPGQARWLAVRILESCGIYETTFAGDGTAPPGPSSNRTLEVAGGVGAQVRTGKTRTKWVCGCGQESYNGGAMSVHLKGCDKGPATKVQEEV